MIDKEILNKIEESILYKAYLIPELFNNTKNLGIRIRIRASGVSFFIPYIHNPNWLKQSGQDLMYKLYGFSKYETRYEYYNRTRKFKDFNRYLQSIRIYLKNNKSCIDDNFSYMFNIPVPTEHQKLKALIKLNNNDYFNIKRLLQYQNRK